MSIKSKLFAIILATFMVRNFSATSSSTEVSRDRLNIELYDIDLGNFLAQRDIPDPNIEVEGVQYGLGGRGLKFDRKGNLIIVHFDQLEEEDLNIPNMDLIFNLWDFNVKNPLRLGKTFQLNQSPEPDGSKIIVRCDALLGEDKIIRISSLLYTVLEGQDFLSNVIVNPIHAFEIYMDMMREGGDYIDCFQLGFGNNAIAAALIENPPKTLERLHDLINEDRIISLFLDKFAMVLLLLLDPDLFVNNFYSFCPLQRRPPGEINESIRSYLYDDQWAPRQPMEIIRGTILPTDLGLNRKKIVDGLSKLKDNLNRDNKYTGDKAAVIKNIEAAIEHIDVQQIALRGGA